RTGDSVHHRQYRGKRGMSGLSDFAFPPGLISELVERYDDDEIDEILRERDDSERLKHIVWLREGARRIERDLEAMRQSDNPAVRAEYETAAWLPGLAQSCEPPPEARRYV